MREPPPPGCLNHLTIFVPRKTDINCFFLLKPHVYMLYQDYYNQCHPGQQTFALNVTKVLEVSSRPLVTIFYNQETLTIDFFLSRRQQVLIKLFLKTIKAAITE